VLTRNRIRLFISPISPLFDLFQFANRAGRYQPDRLMTKLLDIGLPLSTCTQRVRVGPHFSKAISLLFYTPYTHDYTPAHHSNISVKFADDTTVSSDDRNEVEWLTEWCRDNNLLLNTSKTKGLVVDFRKKENNIQPLIINGDCM